MREGSAEALSDAATDHRRRLIAAMVEAASEHGYLGATVSQVVERAGVSRATFYEHFAQRDVCFEAAYQDRVGDVTSSIGAVARKATPAERPDAVLEALVAQLADDRATARFVLIEALAAPAAVRDEHEGLIAGVEDQVARYLDGQDGERAIQIPSTALMAGVADVLTRQALKVRTEDPLTLRSDLVRWIDAYRLPKDSRPLPQCHWQELGRFAKLLAPQGRGEPALLPRGRSSLPEEQAGAARRRRLLDATARLVAEQGYASLTVAQIAAAARVPRAAFYSHFESKQEALMAAQTYGQQGAMAMAAPEYSAAAPWPQRVLRLVGAFLTYLGEMPDYAYLDFVESYAAGSEAVRHRQQNHLVFALFLEDGYRHNPDISRLPVVCTEAIAGAILGLIRKLVVKRRSERLLSLLPAAGYTILAPFIGPQEAAAQVQAWTRGAR